MRIPEFTPAESKVVRLISLGLSTKEVAYLLGKAESTVDNQRTSAMRASRISTSTELVRVALLSGVTTLEDKLSRSERRKVNEFRRSGAKKPKKPAAKKGKASKRAGVKKLAGPKTSRATKTSRMRKKGKAGKKPRTAKRPKRVIKKTATRNRAAAIDREHASQRAARPEATNENKTTQPND